MKTHKSESVNTLINQWHKLTIRQTSVMNQVKSMWTLQITDISHFINQTFILIMSGKYDRNVCYETPDKIVYFTLFVNKATDL